mmetsp:Transcript_4573/g.7098  ORF Transcript_4573/g.7098 Transcript_4573/m.7098 type:complete len:164 (-) Transcript_4573:1972-2463(-)
MYEVQFADEHKQAVAANIIAKNMFAMVDEEGHRHLLFDSIVDFRRTSAVTQEDAFVVSSNGNRRQRETTKGWEILIQWKDGSTTWNKLKNVEDLYPVQLAEFAVQTNVSEEPAFAWWVLYILKQSTGRKPINMVLNCVRLSGKLWRLTGKMETPSGGMPLTKK